MGRGGDPGAGRGRCAANRTMRRPSASPLPSLPPPPPTDKYLSTSQRSLNSCAHTGWQMGGWVSSAWGGSRDRGQQPPSPPTLSRLSNLEQTMTVR